MHLASESEKTTSFLRSPVGRTALSLTLVALLMGRGGRGGLAIGGPQSMAGGSWRILSRDG